MIDDTHEEDHPFARDTRFIDISHTIAGAT